MKEPKSLSEFPNYLIFSNGAIKSIKNGKDKWLKPYQDRCGYLRVDLRNSLGRKVFSVHRLVAKLYLNRTIETKEINHKDGNKTNNNIDNLELVSHRENIIHYYEKLYQKQRGASFHKHSGKWHSQITVLGKCISLGYFDSWDDAINTYAKYKEQK